MKKFFSFFFLLCSIFLLHPLHAATTDKAIQALQKNDFKTALAELTPLAQNGDSNAQFLLGMMYDAGKGVKQDPAMAASWYKKAAAQGHVIAQLYLGILYYEGQGVKRDYKEAARWFQGPANQGNDLAQFYLGWMYTEGKGVPKDEAKAIDWLTKAAMQKNTRAMGMLSTLLFTRYSQTKADQDLIDAYVWSHLAAEYDPIQFTTSTRVMIEGYCSPEQVKLAKKSMEQWKRKWNSTASK